MPQANRLSALVSILSDGQQYLAIEITSDYDYDYNRYGYKRFTRSNMMQATIIYAIYRWKDISLTASVPFTCRIFFYGGIRPHETRTHMSFPAERASAGAHAGTPANRTTLGSVLPLQLSCVIDFISSAMTLVPKCTLHLERSTHRCQILKQPNAYMMIMMDTYDRSPESSGIYYPEGASGLG